MGEMDSEDFTVEVSYPHVTEKAITNKRCPKSLKHMNNWWNEEINYLLKKRRQRRKKWKQKHTGKGD